MKYASDNGKSATLHQCANNESVTFTNLQTVNGTNLHFNELNICDSMHHAFVVK